MASAFSTRPELRGTFGMVASTHWLASAAGMAVLERGGNAFDAAAAAGFVLQVVEPHLNGPGGDMTALVQPAAEGSPRVLCGQGPAPEAASIGAFARRGLDMVPGTGLLAACVPGATPAWLLLLRELGTWRLADVMEFAAGYAESGFPVVPRIADAIASVEPLFRERWPGSAELWLRGGAPPAPGSRYSNPRLAETYRRLVAEATAGGGGREAEILRAERAWSQGFVAEAVDAFARHGPGQGEDGGLITASDLARWEPSFEAPVHAPYHGWRVYKPGPWTQGPVFLQQLSLLEGLDLEGAGAGSAELIHSVAECAKLAFADREAWYGDPAFAEDVVSELLDPEYAASRRGLVTELASLDLRPGSPGARIPRIPGPRSAGVAGVGGGSGDPTFEATETSGRGDTCHLDVVDRWGNMVSATPSGGWLQSSPAIPDLGFSLGTRAQIFTLDPGLPNSLEPGKRPRTTLSATIAEREDGFRVAFGTPGADQQDQWSLNFFVQLVASGWDLQQAIDAPMWHTDHFPRSFHPHESRPGSLYVEDRLPAGAVAELRRRGHVVSVQPPWSLGRLSAVAHDRAADLLLGAANPRGMQGYAVGR